MPCSGSTAEGSCSSSPPIRAESDLSSSSSTCIIGDGVDIKADVDADVDVEGNSSK